MEDRARSPVCMCIYVYAGARNVAVLPICSYEHFDVIYSVIADDSSSRQSCERPSARINYEF